MDHNLFRDYCKAENTDDEEANFDLQSRLYAELYYGPSNIENIDVKPVVKSEIATTASETLQRNESITTTPNPNDSLKNVNSGTNERSSGNSSTATENDNKSTIKHIIASSQTEPLHRNTDSQTNSSISPTKVAEHSILNVSIKKDVDSAIPNAENVSSLDISNVKQERNVAEPEIETRSKEQLSLQRLNPETPVTQSPVSSAKTKQEVTNTESELNENCNNILTKYEFTKLFINKLYLKKYVELEKKIQEMEEEKEKHLKETKRKIDEERRQFKSIADEANTDSKYTVKTTTGQLNKASDYHEEVVLLSESESNSEDSILEVPIPPKPQPPVINLHDDSSDSSSSSDSEADPFTADYKNVPLKNTDDKSKNEKSSHVNTATEDIMLNCTEVQKCASSIKEIREASKTAQLGSNPNQTERLDILYYPFSDEEDTHDFRAPSKAAAHNNDTHDSRIPSNAAARNNVVYERDKNVRISFSDDTPLSNFVNSNEPSSSSNKRRRRESDEACNDAEEKGTTGNESKRSKISPEKSVNNDKNKTQTWEEYFFRPLPDNVKAFYNESRGQENFDIKEVQNNMSKDPRLWTILDEDLMPELARQNRYWNTKCNYCQFEGHKRRNCPELCKPPRCHMCGSEGHTETRCPEKMCLTCGKKQGTFRKTCESCRVLYCNMCNAIGHKSTECPDHWRRFHQTTQNSDINVPDDLSKVMKPADLLYCCNCTKRGHDSSTCNEYRWSQHFPTPAYVSNYASEPRTENSAPTTSSQSEDLIPLEKKKNKCKVFLQGQDNLDGCFVVYSYGAFYTKEPIGEEIKRNLAGDQIYPSELTNFLKGRISPLFLDQLKKIVKFEIKLFYNSQRSLMIRVRSVANIAPRICEIFVFWLKLSDEDKHLDVYTDFPHSRKKMMQFLKPKLDKLEENLGEPDYLYNQIKQLKETASNIRDPTEVASITGQIIHYREKIIKSFNVKPRHSRDAKKLKNNYRVLNRMLCYEVPLPLYFSIIHFYNKVFLPRALTDREWNRFCTAMGRNKKSLQKMKRNADKKKNEEAKQQKQSLTPYEKFIQNLRKMNNAGNIDNRDAATSTSTVVSAAVQNPVVNNTVEHRNVREGNTGNISTENFNMETNVNESNLVYPIESVQLPRNENAPSNNSELMDTVTKYSTLPILTRSSSNHTFGNPNLITIATGSDEMQSSHVPSSQMDGARNNVQGFSEATSSSSKVTEVSTSKETDAKKKKNKKKKKVKTDVENSSVVSENHATDIDASLVSFAERLKDEALSFNLPHMNKAVEEIQKRITDRNLKQEHIDVLQRLIKLEKDHQMYVSSFCNYLQ